MWIMPAFHSFPSGSGQKTGMLSPWCKKASSNKPREVLYNCYLIHSVLLCSKFAPIAIGGLGASLQLLLLDDFMFLWHLAPQLVDAGKTVSRQVTVGFCRPVHSAGAALCHYATQSPMHISTLSTATMCPQWAPLCGSHTCSHCPVAGRWCYRGAWQRTQRSRISRCTQSLTCSPIQDFHRNPSCPVFCSTSQCTRDYQMSQGSCYIGVALEIEGAGCL